MSEDHSVIEIKFDDWIKIGLKYYKDKNNFEFKCASCGNIQSINSVKKENPELDKKEIGQWIYYNCQGRSTNKGCDWTLGGFLQIHKFLVIFPEEYQNQKIPIFEYANEQANEELRKLKINLESDINGICSNK